jgi:hypothetical protein
MNFEDDRLQPIQSADFDVVLCEKAKRTDPFHIALFNFLLSAFCFHFAVATIIVPA